MKYLLDSHALLWFSADAVELSEKARSLILDASDEIVVSMASFWEISIKNALGKLRVDGGLYALSDVGQKNGFEILSIQFNHIALINKLPFHHRDPFDRMLIAQAIAEEMDIISADFIFDQYLSDKPIKRIW
ncbi:MAG: type II toxin-antitoxin system VapC family toxin [Saprospiraceae bacterium]|nr:type II toxin-antitoxin system VapC family toxin [Saprospiraceae bacterium]